MTHGVLASLAAVPILLALSCGGNEDGATPTPVATPPATPTTVSTPAAPTQVATATAVATSPATPTQVAVATPVATTPTTATEVATATATTVSAPESAAGSDRAALVAAPLAGFCLFGRHRR